MNVVMVGCRERTEPLADLGVDGLTLIDDLCARPSKLADVAGVDRLVLLLHGERYVPAQIQQQARRLGVDPLGVQTVRWEEASGSLERLGVILAGAVARAAAFTDSTPQQLKPVLPDRLNRRALLSLPRPVYVAVPEVNTNKCVAAEGCKACVVECPVDAYRWINGGIVYDKEACVSCGRCVTVCPAAAIEHPTVTPVMIRTAISAMIEAAAGPIGIAFGCRRGSDAAPRSGWYKVEVPCASMVPGTWPVAALMLGAGAATIVSCSSSGCSLAHDDIVDRNLDFARSLLGASGIDPARVSGHEAPISPPITTVGTKVVDPFGVFGPSETIAAMSAVSGRTIRFTHPASPVGIVAIDPSTCTMCAICSSVCPTHALHHARVGSELVFTFDGSRCTACEQCVSRCPEVDRGAIVIDHAVDSATLARGPATLNTTAISTCEVCDAPIAPAPMMNRIASILGVEHAATMSYLERRCTNCRGT